MICTDELLFDCFSDNIWIVKNNFFLNFPNDDYFLFFLFFLFFLSVYIILKFFVFSCLFVFSLFGDWCLVN